MFAPQASARSSEGSTPGAKRVRIACGAVFIAIAGLTAACSSDEPTEARQIACKTAYDAELEHAEKQFVNDTVSFKQRTEQEDVPARLSARIQESLSNNLEFVKARASRKLENCLVTGYYERPG